MTRMNWDEGGWTNEPVRAHAEESALVVEAAEGSDAWRTTSYGFVHDTEHALVAPFPTDHAMEVDVAVDFTEQFDQAGLFLRQDAEHWIKCGVEYADGVLQAGAVVTWPRSDWSVAPVPEWNGHVVTVRASRAGDAVTIRARRGDEPWQFLRVVPIPEGAELSAGPFVCAPTRAGLVVRFLGWRLAEADSSLH
ncbi:DUF1349 domain-containing protein [Tessaracoccus oleiagri]|uniref:DUF1349 domain-containing protein n=1 Tax=Tessaracoccus oleiagri TaxID=686624 RepID=A0A1G9IJG3_9ACTN|nr:DUF1349 domain-containing protein [Tessaracoccus oleiagri]SDL25262.1 hypothetical protein SAMN04488242_0974 [Tessaracoccus oleiagri]